MAQPPIPDFIKSRAKSFEAACDASSESSRSLLSRVTCDALKDIRRGWNAYETDMKKLADIISEAGESKDLRSSTRLLLALGFVCVMGAAYRRIPLNQLGDVIRGTDPASMQIQKLFEKLPGVAQSWTDLLMTSVPVQQTVAGLSKQANTSTTNLTMTGAAILRLREIGRFYGAQRLNALTSTSLEEFIDELYALSHTLLANVQKLRNLEASTQEQIIKNLTAVEELGMSLCRHANLPPPLPPAWATDPLKSHLRYDPSRPAVFLKDFFVENRNIGGIAAAFGYDPYKLTLELRVATIEAYVRYQAGMRFAHDSIASALKQN